MADLSLPLLFQLLQSPGQVPVGLVEGFHRVKQLVARLPLELGGHIAQLFGVVNVVLQHILEHGDCLNAAVVVVVVAAVVWVCWWVWPPWPSWPSWSWPKCPIFHSPPVILT